MTNEALPQIELHDFHPEQARFLADVLSGLAGPRKTLPCKYFYDERGSRLFDRICELEEYYPTRTELAIMEDHAAAMADAIGSHCELVEYGSGSSTKTRLLLDHLEAPVAYVPVDISREHLLASAEAIAKCYPQLEVLPVCADFTSSFRIPDPESPPRRRVVYFPGSTLGNFETAAARSFLAQVANQVGHDGGLLIGIDLDKDPAVLERAYDDAEGVTAEFNRNLLRRINRELSADFDLDAFEHRARYVPALRRVEMHLVSSCSQDVRIGEVTVHFEEGESIHTESSHKYTLDGFTALADAAGLRHQLCWTDPDARFAVVLLAAK